MTMKIAILCAVIAIHYVSGYHLDDIRLPPFLGEHGPLPLVVPSSKAREPSTNWIKMPVDHFNDEDDRTWDMRYFASDQHYVKGGPIIIFIGGEWTAMPISIMGGAAYDLAEEHGGYLFYTEHRYYGKSWPVRDLSTPNMKYLSVEQSLADLAQFIRQMKSDRSLQDAKVVVIGCSYAGTMASWSRLKYPDLVDFAYASSAPRMAIDDFHQYLNVVGEQYKLKSSECWDVINDGMREMTVLFKTEKGRKTLRRLIDACYGLQDSFPSREFFFQYVAFHFGALVQRARPGDIENVCEALLEEPGKPAEKVAFFIQDISNGRCFLNYEQMLRVYSDTRAVSNSRRTWFYQKCSEFGFFKTGNSTTQPFGLTWSSELGHSFCKAAFDLSKEETLAGIAKTNQDYGGANTSIPYVISVHGNADPWYPTGQLETFSDDSPVIFIDGTSHCADLSSSSHSDSFELRTARLEIKDTIAKWLA